MTLKIYEKIINNEYFIDIFLLNLKESTQVRMALQLSNLYFGKFMLRKGSIFFFISQDDGIIFKIKVNVRSMDVAYDLPNSTSDDILITKGNNVILSITQIKTTIRYQ